MPDWDLIRYFLAVADAGSTLVAARNLGDSQPTVARRIAALEQEVGVQLFDRRTAGYRLTTAGSLLLERAREAERAASAFWNAAQAEGRSLTGTIRFTTVDMFANYGLSELLAAFAERYPEVRVDVIAADRLLDLAAGEADVALRARPTPGPFVCRKVAEFGWALFCSRSYAEAQGCPGAVEELAGHAVIGPEGSLARSAQMQWLEAQVPAERIRYRSNNLQGLLSNALAGLGIALLPVPLAARFGDLVRCLPAPAELRSEGWLMTHERLRQEPHVRAFMDFVAQFLAERRPRSP